MDTETVQLIIDSRESRLIEFISKQTQTSFTTGNLDLGDIIIKSSLPDAQFTLIFERKTYADLDSSIKDGRYREQKVRLLSTYQPYECSYIIEGDRSHRRTIQDSILDGVVFHTMYRDKMHVIFTDSMEDTATFVVKLFHKCQKNPQKFVATNSCVNSEYITNLKVKSKKSDNIDKKTCYILQLSQIPGISYRIATEIANKYPSMQELITAINSAQNKTDVFTCIDKIGKKKAQTIIDYIY